MGILGDEMRTGVPDWEVEVKRGASGEQNQVTLNATSSETTRIKRNVMIALGAHFTGLPITFR